MSQRPEDETIDDKPVYNVRAVAQQTGLPAATLRAWERRYGFPAPRRTASGYRLYSSRDIDRLRWLKAQIDNGMAISQAVALLNSRREAGQDPAAGAPARRSTAAVASAQNLNALEERLYSAAARFDHAEGEELLNQAFATHPIEDVCLRLFEPLMSRVGRGWQSGELSVQAEHFATNLLRERVITLAHAAPAPHRAGRVLAACAPGEWHELGLLVTVLFLRRAGFPVTHLGQNVPVARIVETMDDVRPDAVLIGASTLAVAPGVLDLAAELDKSRLAAAQPPRLLYGGRIFNVLPELQSSIPGIYAGRDAAEVVATLERLPDLAASPAQPAPPEAIVAAVALRRYQPAIEAAVAQSLSERAHGAHFHAEAAYAQSATADVTHALVAALRFGQSGLLSEPGEWARDALPAYGVPRPALRQHLRAYRRAIHEHLPPAEARTAREYLAVLENAMSHFDAESSGE